MMENGTSLADLAAVSNMNNNDGFYGGGWLWFIVVIFAIMGGGFWGGNQNYATSADVQRATDLNTTMARFDVLTQNQSQNAMDNMALIDRNAMDNANLINQNRYDNAQLINAAMMNNTQNAFGIAREIGDGFAGVDKSLCGISHQIANGVCEIKTQLLQDKYDQLLNEYNLSTMANANNVQTQNILNSIGSWYAKPPYYPQPYYYGGTTVA